MKRLPSSAPVLTSTLSAVKKSAQRPRRGMHALASRIVLDGALAGMPGARFVRQYGRDNDIAGGQESLLASLMDARIDLAAIKLRSMVKASQVLLRLRVHCDEQSAHLFPAKP